MPIPYRDQDELDGLGVAAFLRVLTDDGYRGALFQINARGEPLEFTYNRVETPNTFLWRPADLRRAALKQLVASLLAACPRVPSVLLCLAAEVPSELFGQDLRLALPVGRVAAALEAASYSAAEIVEALAADPDSTEGTAPATVFWFPAPGDAEHALVQHLGARGLLWEPFARAETGLDEVYGRLAEDAPDERPWP